MNLSPEAKEARRQYMKEYMREWRRKKSEKVDEIKTRFWERKAEEMRNVK